MLRPYKSWLDLNNCRISVFKKIVSLSPRTFASLRGTFGTELFHGSRDHDSGVRLKKLSCNKSQAPPKLQFHQYRTELAQSAREIFMSDNCTRSYFYLDLPETATCTIGTTDNDGACSNDIKNELFSRTRGFSIQLIVHGKGCRLFYDPEWPHLKYKGRGLPIDFTNTCIRMAADVRIHLSKTGFIMTIYGHNLSKVRAMARTIQTQSKLHLYSMTGITYSLIPVVQLKRAKKK